MEIQKVDRRFVLWAGITLILLYLVILAGSVVRATGSGMGCPDWPRCFGYYIPPTEQSQIEFLPNHDYNKGMLIIANDTLWRAKDHFTSGASFERVNWEKYPKHDYAEFNAAQTWTEYINRLCGALSGLASLIMLFFAFRRWKEDKLSLGLAVLHLIVIGYVAWLGKTVVDSNLNPWVITQHMLCALIMVFLVSIIRYRTKSMAGVFERVEVTGKMRALLIFSLVFTLAQIVMGTQVRQEVDVLIKTSEDTTRQTWIELLSGKYILHFTVAMVLALMNIYIWLKLRKQFNIPQAKVVLNASLFIVLITYGAGVLMHRFAIPAMVQPMHLFCAMVLAGVQFGLILRTR